MDAFLFYISPLGFSITLPRVTLGDILEEAYALDQTPNPFKEDVPKILVWLLFNLCLWKFYLKRHSYPMETKPNKGHNFPFCALCLIPYQPTSLVQTWRNQRVYRWHQRYVSSQGKGYFSWSVSTTMMSFNAATVRLSESQFKSASGSNAAAIFHSLFSLVFRNFLKKFVYADF